MTWQPDAMLVPALLAGSPTRMDDLDGCDRTWAVVVMTDDEEMPAEAIAERLDCSLRLVRSILASAAAVLMRVYRAEAETFERELAMTAGEVARLATALADTAADRDRMQAQRDRLLAVHLAERAGEVHPSCGCPVTRYNTYIDPRGKRGCREHRRLAVARHRARKRGTEASGTSVDVDQPSHCRPVAQLGRDLAPQPSSSRYRRGAAAVSTARERVAEAICHEDEECALSWELICRHPDYHGELRDSYLALADAAISAHLEALTASGVAVVKLPPPWGESVQGQKWSTPYFPVWNLSGPGDKGVLVGGLGPRSADDARALAAALLAAAGAAEESR